MSSATRRSEWRQAKLDELGSVGRGRSKHRPRNDPTLYGGPAPRKKYQPPPHARPAPPAPHFRRNRRVIDRSACVTKSSLHGSAIFTNPPNPQVREKHLRTAIPHPHQGTPSPPRFLAPLPPSTPQQRHPSTPPLAPRLARCLVHPFVERPPRSALIPINLDEKHAQQIPYGFADRGTAALPLQ